VKAIIFAAGLGTRISRHIGNKPKCLIEVFGVPLIAYTIDLLQKKGIHDIAVVTGYHADEVERALPDTVHVFRNPFFSVTNSIASLWFARDFISGPSPLLAMNGDVFVEEIILEKILEAEQGDNMAVMVADSSRIVEADYKFSWDNGHLEKYGKELQPYETTGEYVGLGIIYPENLAELVSVVDHDVMSGDYNKWWEDAIYIETLYGRNIGVIDISGEFWVELDFVEDLNRLNEYTKRKLVCFPGYSSPITANAVP
jgi:choline kinase